MHVVKHATVAIGLSTVLSCLTMGIDSAQALPSPDVVISQVYGGGGNSGATYRNDFIELFNRGGAAVNLTGWSVQYGSSTGTGNWAITALSGTIAPGAYYLVQEAVGAGGTVNLPTPDAVGTLAMSGTTGKVALVSSTSALSGACPLASIVDVVGYGAANCSATSPTPQLSNTTAALRGLAGCTDSANNQADFSIGAPTPRNRATPQNGCPESAPAVSATTPAGGASAVPSGSQISVTFNEPVNLSAGAIDAQCPPGTSVATSSAATNVSNVSITPAIALPLGATCNIIVSRLAVSDVDLADPPDQPAQDFVASFTVTGATACAAVDAPIGTIQGAGTSAALTGTRTVQGVAVADFEYSGSGVSADSLRVFFLQNEGSQSDGDATTSDGIFVFNGNNNSVSLGQVVQVTGTVTEFDFFSAGGTLTEISSPTIELCGSTASIEPSVVSLPVASRSLLERFEGMLVRFPQALYVTEHFQLGRFSQVLLSSGARLPQPTNVANPGSAALAQQALNDLSRILLDDDLQQQNPDPIRFARGALPLSAANTLRGGDTVQGLTGVLTESDATTAANVTALTDPVRYRLRPFNVLNAQTPSFQAVNARPTLPLAVSGTLKIASANLLNYFNTFGGSCTYGVGGGNTDCRGADNQAELDRQWPKTVAHLLATSADVIVVNEFENDGYAATSAIADLLNRLNGATAPGTFAFIDVDARTGQVNALGTDAIRVGILYKPSVVTPVGTTAVANTDKFGLYQTSGGAIQRNRPALAQAFQTAAGGRVIVVGNHLKSKGSSCADNVSPVPSDPDLGDGQGECNMTRQAAAEQLVTWLAGNPTGTGDPDVLIMGDLNAYAKEDPVVALESGGYVNLIASRIGAGAYSYVFDGQWSSWAPARMSRANKGAS